MAKRDQLGSAFRRHDTGHPRDPEDVAFFMFARQNQIKGFRLHFDNTLGDSNPPGLGLIAHVNHVGFSLGIEMGQFTHARYI
jgi:hypothetical protein